MKKYILLGLIAITAVGITGCLMTGQVTFVESIDVGVTANDNIYHYALDLNTNSDFADNKDKIKSVDAVSFVARIKNNETSASAAELYISRNAGLSTVAEIRDEAIPVFITPSIPAGDTLLIKWNDSFKYMRNLDSLFYFVKELGAFSVYGIADTDSTFSDSIKAQVVVTFTIGK
jgi:hypothetical protein